MQLVHALHQGRHSSVEDTSPAYWRWRGWSRWSIWRLAPPTRAGARVGNLCHQGPEHGYIDNCKKLPNCTNNKDVYLTVLLAHAREGHLQYLWSLEADLADAEQDEGDDAGESVPASSNYKEGEAGACELEI
jgi:hypothetical protein